MSTTNTAKGRFVQLFNIFVLEKNSVFVKEVYVAKLFLRSC